MKLKVTRGEKAGYVCEAEITCDHAASREGVPVLVVDGAPVPIVDALEAGFAVVEASAEERGALQEGGYALTQGVLQEEPA